MRVLLVNPPKCDVRKWGKPLVVERVISPPLGIGYIAALLEKERHSVRAVDMYNYDWDRARRTIAYEAPAIVGITCLTEQRMAAFRLAEMIKSFDQKITVVMGGAHVSIMPEQVLRNVPADVVVIGEGEITFLELVRALEERGDLGEVDGIAYTEGGEVIKTKPRAYIADLDSLSFPAYNHFVFDAYAIPSGYEGIEYRGIRLDLVRRISIITSRGCPYNCQFCSSQMIWKRRWRCRSATNVVDEMEMLHRRYGYVHFDFADDIFGVSERNAIEICKAILSRGLGIAWCCETRVDCVSEEMLFWMQRAGCYLVAYGVESGSASILRSINKTISVEDVGTAFQRTRGAGIRTLLLLMVGNPGETEGTVKETLELVRVLKPDRLAVTTAMVYPGTALYEVAKSRGFIDDEYWLTAAPPPYYTVENDIRTLNRWRNRILGIDERRSLPVIAARAARDFLWQRTGIFVSPRGLARRKYR